MVLGYLFGVCYKLCQFEKNQNKTDQESLIRNQKNQLSADKKTPNQQMNHNRQKENRTDESKQTNHLSKTTEGCL